MSNKEKVLAYFEEWADKEENPENGIGIKLEEVGYDSLQAYALFDSDGTRVTAIFTDNDDCHMYEIIARILKLDPPQAAPIKWSKTILYDEADWFCQWESDCGCFMVITRMNNEDGSICYKAATAIGDEWNEEDAFDTSDEAFRRCQEYKQIQIQQLGGYNEQ